MSIESTPCFTSKFYAYLSRLRWIKRWGLMRNAVEENVMEHSWEVAVIAHLLATIRNRYFQGGLDANAVAVAALFHDASEVLTGDLPTPVKYYSSNLTGAYRRIESVARQELLGLLPEALRDGYRAMLDDEQWPDSQRQLIKAADTLSAYLKCLTELRAGNVEFDAAAKQLEAKLQGMALQEVDYFLRVFAPDCALPLDSLLRQAGQEI